MKVNKTLSTNSLLWEMLEIKPYKNGFSVIANEQTKGKGQKGNLWISESGKNLTTSIYISSQLKVKEVFYLNIMAALAIHRTLLEYDIKSEIKWPNDILVNGHKIAGLLIENQIQGQAVNRTVVGVGLNINQSHFSLLRPVTSISKELGRNISIESVFHSLYKNLDFFYNSLVNKDFKLLKKLYLQRLYQYQKKADYQSEINGTFTGSIEGIDENGQLIIELIDKTKIHFDMQTIRFL